MSSLIETHPGSIQIIQSPSSLFNTSQWVVAAAVVLVIVDVKEEFDFFNAKSNCQLPKTNHCQQLLDTFDSSVVFVNHCINKGIHG